MIQQHICTLDLEDAYNMTRIPLYLEFLFEHNTQPEGELTVTVSVVFASSRVLF